MELTPEMKEALEKGRAQYGSVFVGAIGGHVFMVRPATPVEATRYQDKLSKLANPKAPDSTIRTAQKTLAKAAMFYPSGDEQDELFSSYPFLHTRVADKCIDMSGGEIEELGNG